MTTTPQIPRHHRLILVRHAQSAVDPQRPPSEWGLTESGTAAARRLAALGLFDRAHAFYAGAEPKMVQTCEPVAAERERQVQVDPAFSETRSEGFFGSDEFLVTIRRFLDRPEEAPAPGWESAVQARARFGAGVERLRQFHEPEMNRDRVLPGTVAIFTGGRMITSYLAGVLRWAPEDAFTRWQALKMPDVCVLELDEAGQGTIVIPCGSLLV
jgi:broad specificity phosphatase PhoE